MTPCRHTFRPDPRHPDYETCCACDTSHSTVAPAPEDVYTADYWTPERGHSTLEEQVYNCDIYEENGKTKNQFVLDLIDVPKEWRVIEIGCSPGSLCHRLDERGFEDVSGVDRLPMERYGSGKPGDGWSGPWVYGFFPQAVRNWANRGFGLIIACDVFEHSHEPEAFIMECARLLRDGGQLILMLPLIVEGEELPERMWHSQEHVYLHSLPNLTALLSVWGFTDIEFSRWCPGHECISAHWRERPVYTLRERVPDAVYDGDECGCF